MEPTTGTTRVAPAAARRRRTRVALATTAAAALVSAVAAGSPAAASSHREAPSIAGSPRLDATDVYAFLSPDKKDTVTLIGNWIPFEEPAGGPNFFTFDDDAVYDLNVDTDGDAKQDVVFRFDFHTAVKNKNSFLYNTGPVTSLDDPDLNVLQTYSVQKYSHGKWRTVARKVPVAPSNVGTASMPKYADLRKEAVKKAGDLEVFAGQADDPFFLDLRVFNLLYGGDLSEVGNDTLAGYNVNSIAVQVPVKDLGGKKNIVGVWSTTSKKDSRGRLRQVSRLGSPLVNEVVIPIKAKDKFNASAPKDDGQFLKFVTEPELPKVVEAVFKIKAPKEPRNDLVQVFLTGVPGLNQPEKVTPSEQLRLNLTEFKDQKASRLGVIGGDNNGFPNGRRLSDDVIDASLQVVEGELVGAPNDLGDAVDKNDVALEKKFPYVGLPSSGSGSVNSPADSSGGDKGKKKNQLNGGADDKKQAEADKAEQDKAKKDAEAGTSADAEGAAQAEAAATLAAQKASQNTSSGFAPTPLVLGLAAAAALGGAVLVRRRRQPARGGHYRTYR